MENKVQEQKTPKSKKPVDGVSGASGNSSSGIEDWSLLLKNLSSSSKSKMHKSSYDDLVAKDAKLIIA